LGKRVSDLHQPHPFFTSPFLPFLYSVFRAQILLKNQGKDFCPCLFCFVLQFYIRDYKFCISLMFSYKGRFG
ncbi:MAG: hypothetical protein ACLVDF_07345, partial [Acutalibacteraceae bacterium]